MAAGRMGTLTTDRSAPQIQASPQSRDLRIPSNRDAQRQRAGDQCACANGVLSHAATSFVLVYDNGACGGASCARYLLVGEKVVAAPASSAGRRNRYGPHHRRPPPPTKIEARSRVMTMMQCTP